MPVAQTSETVSSASVIPGSAGASNPTFQAGAAVTFSERLNVASAYIGDGAVVRAEQGNVQVKGLAIDNHQISASGSASGADQVAVGGGVMIAEQRNVANAWIGAATVDARRQVLVRSNAQVPNQIDLFATTITAHAGTGDVALIEANGGAQLEVGDRLVVVVP